MLLILILIIIILSIAVPISTTIFIKYCDKKALRNIRKLSKKYKIGQFCIVITAISSIVLSLYFFYTLIFLVAMVLLNFIFKENFPFSTNPMYSTFRKRAFYIYITDESDEAIPLTKEFGVWSSYIKKIYVLETRRISGESYIYTASDEELQKAGTNTLNFLKQLKTKDKSIKYKRLRLHQVIISLESGKIRKDSKLISEISL